MTRTDRHADRWLLAAIAVGVAARLVAAVYQGNTVLPLPGMFDQLSYDALAWRVAQGWGFSFAEGHWPATAAGAPTAHWSFLYTGFLAAIYSVVGHVPVVARVLQAIALGALQPWLTFRLADRAFDRTTARIAAMASAGYAYFVYYGSGLLTDASFCVSVLWTLDSALRLAAAPTPRMSAWLELGLACGITVLLRQLFGLFVPALFLWMWWSRARRHDHGWRAAFRAMMAGLVCVSGIVLMLVVPFTVRNYVAFSTIVPLNTNAGFALYWGNHPVHGNGFYPLLPADAPSYGELVPPSLRGLNEGQLDRALLWEALRLIAADPARYLRMSMARTREYLKFWPEAGSSAASNAVRVASFGALLPLMLAGLWMSTRGAVPMAAEPAALLGLFAATHTLTHLLTWTLIRYRLPADAVLIVFAAVAIGEAMHRARILPERAIAGT